MPSIIAPCRKRWFRNCWQSFFPCCMNIVIESNLTRLDETLARMREQIEAVETEIVPLALS